MRRVLFALASCVVVAGCSNRTDGALRVVVTVEPTLKADCFEVVFSKGGTTLAYEDVKRDAAAGAYTMGAKQGSMPAAVTIQAKAYLGDCTDAVNRKFNGQSTAVDHTFPNMGVEQVDLKLSPPDTTLDNDHDGYVDVQKGGSDCNDTDGTIHPGSTQACGIAVDTNCDGTFGCADPDCQAESSCASPATQLGFSPGATSFQRTGCSQDIVLEVRNAQGLPTPVPLDTTITFTTSDPNVKVLGGGCSASPITSVTIPYNESTVHLTVRSLVAGAQTVTAKTQGLADGTLSLNVTPLATAALVFTSTPQTIKAGDCSAPISVELRDAAANPTTAAVDTALGLSTTATGNFDFFAESDTTCATPLSAPATLTVLAGQGGGKFRVRSAKAALPSTTFTLGVHDAAGSTPDSQTLTVKPGDPAKLVFTSAQPGLQQTTCSTSAVRVELQDAQGNTTTSPSDTFVTMDTVEAVTSPSYFTFFTYTGTTVACTTAVSSTAPVKLAAGGTALAFALRAQGVGSYTMRAAASGLTPGTQTAVISAGPPNHLVVTAGGGQTVTAGTCSGAVTVQAQDNTNTASGPTADVQVTVAATNGVVPYSDPSCGPGTALVGGKFTIAANTTGNTFYFKGNTSGPTTLTLTSSFPTVTQGETINAGAPSKLVFGTPSTATIQAGACSVALPVLVQDGLGNAASFTSLQTLNVSSSPSGPTFSSGSSCGSPATSFSLPAGASLFNLYATHTVPGPYSLTAAIGALSTTPAATLTVTPAAVSKLVYTAAPPGTVTAGACSMVTVQRQDAYNNPVPAPTGGSAEALSWAWTGTPPTVGANGGPPTFFTLAGCTGTAVTSATIAATNSSATFYAKGLTAGTGQLKTSETVSLFVQAPMQVNPAAATRLSVSVAPAPLTVGGCSTASGTFLSRLDPYDNVAPDASPVTVGLSATGSPAGAAAGLSYFTDGACATTATTSFIIPSGSGQIALGIKGTTAGSVTVTAAQPPTATLTSGSVSFSLIAATPGLYYQTPPPASVAAGTCSQVDVVRRDGLGNLVPQTANVNIALAASGITPAGVAPQFFAGASGLANCNAGTSPVSLVQMANGTSTVTFWVRGRGQGTATITATDPNLTLAASSSMGVTPGPTASIALTIAPTSLQAGTCATTAKVDRFDAFLNPSVDAALAVNLTSSGSATVTAGMKYYTDTGCTQNSASSGAVSIPLGASTATFSVNGTVAGSGTVTATAGSFTSPVTLTFTAGPVTKVVITAPASSPVPTVVSNACNNPGITLQTQDQYGNPSNPAAALSIALSSNAAGTMTFYQGGTCGGGAVTGVSIANTTNTATFSFKATKAETATVTATPAGSVAAITQDWSVTPAGPSKLAFKAGTQPSSLTALACGATPMTVQIQDAQGNAITPSAFSTAHTFQFNSSVASVGLFFSINSNCTPLLVPATYSTSGVSEFTVYLMAAGQGSTNVTVSDTSGSAFATTATALAITSSGTTGALAVTATPTTVEPGFCQAIQVQRQGAASAAWTAGTTPVTLSLPGGTTELTLHTDPACSSATTTSVTGSIGNTASTVTFYAKGHSAASGTTILATATDTSNVFSNGTLTLTPLPLVRRGTCAFGSGSTFTTGCTVSPTIPGNVLSRTLLVFQAIGPGPTPSDGSVECHLTAGSGVTVDCTRFGSASALTVAWQTVSFGTDAANGGLTVTQKTLDGATLAGAASYLDATGVDAGAGAPSAFLLYSAATDDTGYSAASFPDGYLSDPSHVTFNAGGLADGGTGFLPSTTISYQLVQLSGATVDRGQPTSGLAGQSFNVGSLPNRVVGQTVMLHSVRFGPTNDTTDACRKRYRGTVSANNAISFERNMGTGGTPCANVDPVELAWERVQFPASVLVQPSTVPVLNGAASANSAALTTAVAPHKTLLFFSGQGPAGQAGGETTVSGSDFGWSTAMADFAGSGATRSTVTVTKGQSSANASDDSSFTVFVVQFSP